MEYRALCFFCSKYKGFHPCLPLQNNLPCNNANNWEHFKRNLVMVYTPCVHCKYHTICSKTDICNQNSKWPHFKKKEDFNEVPLHDGSPRKKS